MEDIANNPVLVANMSDFISVLDHIDVRRNIPYFLDALRDYVCHENFEGIEFFGTNDYVMLIFHKYTGEKAVLFCGKAKIKFRENLEEIQTDKIKLFAGTDVIFKDGYIEIKGEENTEDRFRDDLYRFYGKERFNKPCDHLAYVYSVFKLYRLMRNKGFNVSDRRSVILSRDISKDKEIKARECSLKVDFPDFWLRNEAFLKVLNKTKENNKWLSEIMEESSIKSNFSVDWEKEKVLAENKEYEIDFVMWEDENVYLIYIDELKGFFIDKNGKKMFFSLGEI